MGAVIEHGHGCPGGVVSGVGDGDVAAGIDELILERCALYAGGIGDFGCNGDRNVGAGSFGEISDLAHLRGSVGREDGGVSRAGGNVLR